MSDFLSYLFAFLVGGVFCVPAQLLLDLTRMTPARILVLYVVAGVGLCAVGAYEPLLSLAGEGAALPLSGFGAAVGRGVREAVDKEGALGILKGALTAASGGTTAALCFGYLAALLFHGKPKRL